MITATNYPQEPVFLPDAVIFVNVHRHAEKPEKADSRAFTPTNLRGNRTMGDSFSTRS